MIQFKENTAYHAETEEQAIWLLNQTDWTKEHIDRYIYNWSFHKKETCYVILGGRGYSRIGYFEEIKYTIIKVSDLSEWKEYQFKNGLVVYFKANDPSTYHVNEHGNIDIIYSPQKTVLHDNKLVNLQKMKNI